MKLGNGYFNNQKGKYMETKKCEIHQIEMPQFEKEGRKWFSHKLEDGTWCKGQPRRVHATFSISKNQGEFSITYTTDDRGDFDKVLKEWTKQPKEEEYEEDPELDKLLGEK